MSTEHFNFSFAVFIMKTVLINKRAIEPVTEYLLNCICIFCAAVCIVIGNTLIIIHSYMTEKIAQRKRVNTKEDILTDKNLRSGNS